MKIFLFAFMINSSLTLPPLGAHYDYKFESQTSKHGQFESEMGGKAERGATNILYGWTEFMKTPIEMARGPEHHLITAMLIGVPYGLIRAAARTVVGGYEVATFYAPQPPLMSPIEGDVF